MSRHLFFIAMERNIVIIHYFNLERMWNLSTKLPLNRYDTGAWYLEECDRQELPHQLVNIGEYIVHFGQGS